MQFVTLQAKLAEKQRSLPTQNHRKRFPHNKENGSLNWLNAHPTAQLTVAATPPTPGGENQILNSRIREGCVSVTEIFRNNLCRLFGFRLGLLWIIALEYTLY